MGSSTYRVKAGEEKISVESSCGTLEVVFCWLLDGFTEMHAAVRTRQEELGIGTVRGGPLGSSSIPKKQCRDIYFFKLFFLKVSGFFFEVVFH